MLTRIEKKLLPFLRNSKYYFQSESICTNNGNEHKP